MLWGLPLGLSPLALNMNATPVLLYQRDSLTCPMDQGHWGGSVVKDRDTQDKGLILALLPACLVALKMELQLYEPRLPWKSNGVGSTTPPRPWLRQGSAGRMWWGSAGCVR